MLDGPVGFTHSIGRSGARGDYVKAWAFRLVLYRDVACRYVGDHGRDEQGRYPLPGRVFDHLADLAVLGRKTSDTRPDIDAEPEGIDVLSLSLRAYSALADSLVSGGYSVEGEGVLLADEGLVHPVFLGIEVLDYPGDLDGKLLRRESSYVIYT